MMGLVRQWPSEPDKGTVGGVRIPRNPPVSRLTKHRAAIMYLITTTIVPPVNH